MGGTLRLRMLLEAGRATVADVRDGRGVFLRLRLVSYHGERPRPIRFSLDMVPGHRRQCST